MKVFTWEDFKQFNVPPETLAAYCNKLLEERCQPVRLDKFGHDVIRENAFWTAEYLANFPLRSAMLWPPEQV